MHIGVFETILKNPNFDLRNLCNWLKSNKISLNQIIFH